LAAFFFAIVRITSSVREIHCTSVDVVRPYFFFFLAAFFFAMNGFTSLLASLAQ
jgi:hypothetical protein